MGRDGSHPAAPFIFQAIRRSRILFHTETPEISMPTTRADRYILQTGNRVSGVFRGRIRTLPLHQQFDPPGNTVVGISGY
jgi:hypothetical protein